MGIVMRIEEEIIEMSIKNSEGKGPYIQLLLYSFPCANCWDSTKHEERHYITL
jgi:hypothetical protein